MIWVIKGWRNLPAHCLFPEKSTPPRSVRLFCCRISLLIIPDNYKYVRRVTAWRLLTPAPWRAGRLKWHGDTSHPLPLSISSRCSRLMELLIGENWGFLDGPVAWWMGRMGGRPLPYLPLQKAELLCRVFSTPPQCTQPQSFLFGFLHI